MISLAIRSCKTTNPPELLLKKLQEAVDDVRSAEAKRMAADGHEPILKQSRWCLLKRPENLTSKQNVKLRDLLRYNLQSVRAYLLKEDFDQFRGYVSPAWAGKFLDLWCHQVCSPASNR